MKKYLYYICLLTAFIAAASQYAYAVKAQPGIFTVTQPDGTTLDVQLMGDEHFHYYLTDDGYPLINENDTYYYAKATPEGKLLRSSMTARRADKRDAEAKAFLRNVDADETIEAMPRRYGLFPGATFPAKGEQKALVILVEFSDRDFLTPGAGEYFTAMLNSEGFDTDGATGSARDYFVQNSSGMFIPEFDVYGPVTLEQPTKYYGGNDTWGNDKAPHKMIIEACELIDESVDFTQYDRDGDGVIDNVFVFYAGRGEATNGGANTVWPHSAYITEWEPGVEHLFDGVRLDSYACTNEWVSGHTCGIGTFCHEFSHVLGLPDLYPTTYSSAFTPGNWSLMDSGSYNNGEKTPAGYSIFERNALGWIEPRAIDASGQGNITLLPVTENDGAIICTPDEEEFFLLENRQKDGWDSYIPGHGMLVWHIDYVDRIWINNSVNNSQRHQYVDIEEADNIASELTRAGDAFPGTAGITEISFDTSPSLRTWSGDDTGIAIKEITETEDGLITFNVYPSDNENTVSTDKITAGGSRLSVDGRLLRIVSGSPASIRVTCISGTTIYAQSGDDITVTLPSAGIYIVTVDGESSKIAVR